MEKAVEIRNLTVEYQARHGRIKVLDGLDLEIGIGQVFGFLGPNGAGKTTTMHVLLGFAHPSSGTAHIFGEDVSRSIARRRIGYLPEHPDMYKFLSGRELLKYSGQLFGMKGGMLSDRVESLLKDVDMEEAADRRIATYSRGMMQRICLAQALVNDPDLVILDEPTGGLDPFGRMGIRKIITRLKLEGKTVFFSSHELSEVELVCDHIAIIAKGRIVAEGSENKLIQPGGNLEKFFIETIEASANDDKD